MKDWKPWDWLAFSLIFLAAIFEAVSAASKDLPDLSGRFPVFYSPHWSYAPLALLLVATTIVIYQALRGKLGAGSSGSRRDIVPPRSAPVTEAEIAQLEQIVGKHFTNERVELDGKRYLACTFTNITFVYNGGVQAMEKCNIIGPVNMETEDLRIASFMQLAIYNGVIGSILNRDQGVLTREQVLAQSGNTLVNAPPSQQA